VNPRPSNPIRHAPLIAGALLVLMLVLDPFHVGAVEGADEYFQDVRTTVNEIPYKVGDWIGVDEQVAPAAVRLLQPTVILQRRYTNRATGQVVSLLVVHCADTRDMQGHYPPVCYPAHGWTSEGTTDRAIPAGAASLPAREYAFERVRAGSTARMRVVNFFAVPGSEAQFYAEIGGVDRASRSVRAAGLGAAQIQIITMDPRVDLDEVVDEFVAHLEPALRVIAEGAPDA